MSAFESLPTEVRDEFVRLETLIEDAVDDEESLLALQVEAGESAILPETLRVALAGRCDRYLGGIQMESDGGAGE